MMIRKMGYQSKVCRCDRGSLGSKRKKESEYAMWKLAGWEESEIAT